MTITLAVLIHLFLLADYRQWCNPTKLRDEWLNKTPYLFRNKARESCVKTTSRQEKTLFAGTLS
jgi:hypothetical protein